MIINTLKLCRRCKGPIFYITEIDNEGNKIGSVKCWNGHYHTIIIKDIEKGYTYNYKHTINNNVIAHISFIDLKLPKK